MKTNPIGHLVKTNPNKANLHFTAENAEKKDICVSDCSIEKYALYPISPCFHPSQWLCYGEWTLRTRRLMKNKAKTNPILIFHRGERRVRRALVA